MIAYAIRYPGLVSILKDMNTLTPEMHQNSNFNVLYTAIEKRMKEGPDASLTETTKDTKTAKGNANSGENVTATNGSVSVGKFHVGGNVDGNIVIGNNNQVNSNKKK